MANGGDEHSNVSAAMSSRFIWIAVRCSTMSVGLFSAGFSFFPPIRDIFPTGSNGDRSVPFDVRLFAAFVDMHFGFDIRSFRLTSRWVWLRICFMTPAFLISVGFLTLTQSSSSELVLSIRCMMIPGLMKLLLEMARVW